MRRIKVYLDFDGTITENDVVDMMLDRFADRSWQDVEKQWQAGTIGSRECLTRQIALLKVAPQDLERLCEEIKVDPYFVAFLESARRIKAEVRVVSDGFDFVIERVLARVLKGRADIMPLPVSCNRLLWTPDGPRAAFSNEEGCRHACANCKPEFIKKTAMPDDHILFVGDGLSDCYAAEIANITFAKGNLLQYCRDNNLNHLSYENFGQVAEWLEKNHQQLKNYYEIRPTLS